MYHDAYREKRAANHDAQRDILIFLDFLTD